MTLTAADLDALAVSKASLRKSALARRAAVGPEARAEFAAYLATEGLAIARRLAPRAVSLFRPIRDEPDVLPLLDALAQAGFVTALPVTGPRGAALVFRAWRPGDHEIVGPMRIPEPAPHLPVVEPDLLFVPLTVFDRRGNRIGYGAGYYDLTLQRLRGLHAVISVGIAYAAQEAPTVSAGPHDQKLDFVLTEHGLIDCRG